MNIYQISQVVILCVFYFAYFYKMARQRNRGITTNQMGKGNKKLETLRIERVLSIATFIIVPVELVSILLDTHIFISASLTLIGIIICAIGVLVFIIAMITMKDSWRAGIPNDEKTNIVKSGIYKLSRNPAFLGFDLMYIGTFIAYSNVFHFLFAFFAIVMLHLQILEEEKYLIVLFGDEYAEYKKQTGRYFVFL